MAVTVRRLQPAASSTLAYSNVRSKLGVVWLFFVLVVLCIYSGDMLVATGAAAASFLFLGGIIARVTPSPLS